jgi:hypothetical protein
MASRRVRTFAIRATAVTLPDPTERLVGMMSDFVEAHAAKFLVGL